MKISVKRVSDGDTENHRMEDPESKKGRISSLLSRVQDPNGTPNLSHEFTNRLSDHVDSWNN